MKSSTVSSSVLCSLADTAFVDVLPYEVKDEQAAAGQEVTGDPGQEATEDPEREVTGDE
jgi:hypothetical protein